MATTIEQKPLYNPLPVGQDIIFTLSNSTIVTTYYNVKFVAEVFISGGVPPNTNVNTDLIGTFKAAPNNAGVGMFDFSAVVENYVKADNLISSVLSFSTYKGNGIKTCCFETCRRHNGCANCINCKNRFVSRCIISY